MCGSTYNDTRRLLCDFVTLPPVMVCTVPRRVQYKLPVLSAEKGWRGDWGNYKDEEKGSAPLAPQALETGDFGIVEPIL